MPREIRFSVEGLVLTAFCIGIAFIAVIWLGVAGVFCPRAKAVATEASHKPAESLNHTAPTQQVVLTKTLDLIRDFTEPPSFVITLQTTDRIVLGERSNPDRVVVSITPGASEKLSEAEVSILIKDVAGNHAAGLAYLEACVLFLKAFKDINLKWHIGQIATAMDDIIEGKRSRVVIRTMFAELWFGRGSRDGRDCFILSTKAKDE